MKDFATRTPATKVATSGLGKGPALVDNRTTAVAQRKMQETIANTPRQAAPRPNRTGLPDKLKAGVENLSGYSLDDVKVHYNSAKPAELQAHAYAKGTDIHVAPGQEQHLPHEAWHVVQQKQGRVRPTRQLKGKVSVNDDAGLEKEADVMGSRANQKGVSGISRLLSEPLAQLLTVQRAPHRPEQGSEIRYNGQIWNVTASGIANPDITIHRSPNHTVHLNWATENYTIIRANNANDHDLRENNLGAAGAPVDGYENLSVFERNEKIRTKFSAARNQALTMIKTLVSQQINAGSRASLTAVALSDFEVTRRGPTLLGTGKREEPAQWELKWIEGTIDNARRTWTFVIDSDNPLATSSQDPHVGWQVSAVAGTQGAVDNTFGHVWLDHVPVMRDA
jgi:hypothetical protein